MVKWFGSVQNKVSMISEGFKKLVGRLHVKDVYTTPSFKGGNKYLTVKKTYDPKTKGKFDFYFVERVGKDSVAFLLFDASTTKFGILKQYSSPLEQFTLGCFTGSMEKEGKNVFTTVVEEVIEESGYTVGTDRVQLISTEGVGTCTNELVNLCLVDVTSLERGKRKPENLFERNMTMSWLSASEVIESCEWKAKQIVFTCTHNTQYLENIRNRKKD